MYHVRKSPAAVRPKSFRSSLNVSDFYSVNPMERLDRIGIGAGRYGEKLISLAGTFIKVLMDSLAKLCDRKSILHIAIECTMLYSLAHDDFRTSARSSAYSFPFFPLEMYLFSDDCRCSYVYSFL